MENKGNPSMQELLEMAQSPAGQQLIKMLQQNGGTQLRQAVAKAAAGDYEQAKQTLSSLMENPEAKKLLEQMGGNHGGNGR